MKKTLLTLIVCAIAFTGRSQDASVENSTYGIQTGLLGIWGHNEAKLSNTIVLRTELGFDSVIFGGDSFSDTDFALAPVITLEPRLYYNLNKRVEKSRSIEGNSGNFISLKTSYHPDLFVISSRKNTSIISDISIIPTWGIKRNIGKHLNYEAGAGVGYRYVFLKEIGFAENVSEVAINVHLRIGYRF